VKELVGHKEKQTNKQIKNQTRYEFFLIKNVRTGTAGYENKLNPKP
jgi:hypothetical protein